MLSRDGQAYASGKYTLTELTEALEERGLRSRKTHKKPFEPVARSKVHTMLRNPYYIGIVRYGGGEYEGKHEPIIDPPTFHAVQRILENRNIAGERPSRHVNYLRGSLFCGPAANRSA